MSDQVTHLRHDPARRRAVAGHLARRGREARDRRAARAPRRRHHRGRVPDREPRRLRGGRGDREGRRRARSIAGAVADRASRTSTARGRRCATPSGRASTCSSPRRPIHMKKKLRMTEDQVKAEAAAGVRPGRGLHATTSSSRPRTAAAPTSTSCARCCQPPSTTARRRSTSPTPSATASPRSSAELIALHHRRRSRATTSSRPTATTTWASPSPTRWPASPPAPGRSSARSTVSASGPATPRWKRS